MKDKIHRECKELHHELDILLRSNLQKLSSPLKLMDDCWTQWSLFLVNLISLRVDRRIQSEEVQRANTLFDTLFPRKVSGQLQAFLSDPSGYHEKVRFYEKTVTSLPIIEYSLDQKTFNFLKKDPLRLQEEYFVWKSVLTNQHLSCQPFVAVDLGTGNGRMALRVSEVLSQLLPEASFQVMGLDTNCLNLAMALSQQIQNWNQYKRVLFFAADMLHTPLGSESCQLCTVSSAANLIPSYKRPFQLMEMVRLLCEQGEGVITGPTVHCSIESYIRYVLAERSEHFSSLAWLQRFPGLIRLGKLVDDMTKLRFDLNYLDTEDIFLALEKIGCHILEWEVWPSHADQKNGIFSGIHFQTTSQTKKYVQQYSDFLAQQES